MSYELRALVGLHQVAALAAMEAKTAVIELPQGYGLVPITSRLLDRLGGGMAGPLGDAFWYLSPAVEALARRVSRAGPIAYLEADMFGGTGSQAMMAWRDGEVWLEPAATAFRWPPPDPASNWHWAFNQALRELGVDRGEGLDEFDAVNLGKHRHTEDWQSAG